MDGGNAHNLHAVVITGLKGPSQADKVAVQLSRIIKNMSPDRIERRLSSLPWTLTGGVTSENASRLARFLDKAGAGFKIEPPLQAPIATNVPEAQAGMSNPPLQHSVEAPVQPSPPIGLDRGMTPPAMPAQRTAPGAQGPAERHGFLIEPLSLGGILDRTFQICRAHFWKLFTVQAVWGVALALFGIGVIIVAAVLGVTAEALGKTPPWTLIPMGAVLIPVAGLALTALFFLSQGALIHAVASVYLGREVRVRESYSFAMGKLRKLIFTNAIAILVVGLRLLLVLVLGIVTYYIFFEISSSSLWAVLLSVPFWLVLAYIPMQAFIKMMLVDVVVIVEDTGYVKAINRSWDLVSGKAEGRWPRGHFLRLLILFHLFILIAVAVHVLFEVPAHLTGMILPQTVSQILNEVLSNVGSVVAGLFSSVSLVICYYDIRSRKEGFDLEMLARTRDR
jgi:hypothetical protein